MINETNAHSKLQTQRGRGKKQHRSSSGKPPVTAALCHLVSVGSTVSPEKGTQSKTVKNMYIIIQFGSLLFSARALDFKDRQIKRVSRVRRKSNTATVLQQLNGTKLKIFI